MVQGPYNQEQSAGYWVLQLSNEGVQWIFRSKSSDSKNQKTETQFGGGFLVIFDGYLRVKIDNHRMLAAKIRF